MKNLKTLLILSSLLTIAGVAQAGGHAGAPMAVPAAPPGGASAASASPLADGEIRKVDKQYQKITIKHGEIKSLDMPSMTMVFGVKDPALLDKIKAGDKVKFSAEKAGTAIVVTDIQMAK
jgi:Cu/Ag efflux protein CusF